MHIAEGGDGDLPPEGFIDRTGLANEANRLLEVIFTEFTNDLGIVSRTYPPSPKALLDNFDDLVPFALHFGAANELVTQVRLANAHGLTIESICGKRGWLSARRLDEWLGGLHALYRHTSDLAVYESLRQTVAYVQQHFATTEQFPAAIRIRDKSPAHYSEPWAAGLLEVSVEMRDLFPELAEWALRAMRTWLDDDYYRAHGLFPYRVRFSAAGRMVDRALVRIVKPRSNSEPPPAEGRSPRDFARRLRFRLQSGQYSQLMKSNSTPAFALLAMAKQGDERARTEVGRWIACAIDSFMEGDRVAGEFFPAAGARRAFSAAPSFILADVICDASAELPMCRRYLPVAGRILDRLWQTRLPSGLIPELEGCDWSHIDNQVDVGVTLRRYGELTGSGEHIERSTALISRALQVHREGFAYVTYRGGRKPSVIDPKYNALVLKGMVCLLTGSEKIYETPKLHDLFKDR